MTIKKDTGNYQGRNDQSSHDIFYSRKNYNENAISTSNSHKFIDLWGEKSLYGRVDGEGRPIHLSETNLKALPSKESTIFALDFVVDAYNDFLRYFSEGIIKRRIASRDTVIGDVEPKRAWLGINHIHHSNMKNLYNLFIIGFLKGSGRDVLVLNFETFMDQYINFLALNKGNILTTRSGIMMSSFCSVNVTGLAVEWKTDNHSLDIIKKQIYSDRNFSFYLNAARKFGFYIDKNAPWRLVANISSARMQNYMKQYGLSSKPGSAGDIFDVYYYKSMDKDVDLLRAYMVQMYNSFASAYPTAKAERRCAKTNKKTVKQIRRQKVEENVFDDAYWIEKYFVIRALEHSKTWPAQQLKEKIERAISIKNTIDMKTSLEYINSEIAKG